MSKVRINFTVNMDLAEWAEENDLSPAEARENLRRIAQEGLRYQLQGEGYEVSITASK